MIKQWITFIIACIISMTTLSAQQWAVWKELPTHQAAVTFMYAHEKQLFVGDQLGRVYIYQIDDQGYKKVHHFKAHDGNVSHIELNPQGTQLVTAGYDGWVRLYSSQNFSLLKEFKNAKVEDYDGTKGLESTFANFSPNGSALYIGGYNRQVVKVDLVDGKPQVLDADATYAITCGEVIPYQNLLAYGLGGEVRFYDMKAGKIADFSLGKHGAYQDYVCEVAYIPNKEWLSVWLVSGSIRLYDLKSKQLVKEIAVSAQQGSCRIAVAASGKLLATGNSPTVTLFNPQHQYQQQQLSKHRKVVTNTVFMQNDELLATGGKDRKVLLWRKGGGNTPKEDHIALKGVPNKFTVGESYVLENLKFDQSSYALRIDAKKELDQVKALLQKYATMEIVLEGHTSNEGDAGKNMQLSKQRLESARNYLISKGIQADRVMVKAFGETKPRADNSTISGRIANRRIEMRISKL